MRFFTKTGSLLLALLALAACSESEAQREVEAPVQTVAIETVSSGPKLAVRRFVGRLAPVSTVDISFQVGGRISQLDATEGETVEKGEILAALDPTDFELALRQATLSADLAKADYERKKALVASKSVSNAVFEQSEAEYLFQQVAVDNARRNLAYATIEAPFDALMTRRLTESFTNVQAGTPILRIQDVSEYRVKISVPEDLMMLVRQPELVKVEAVVANGIDRRFALEYREHNTESDQVAQTYEVTFGMARPTDVALLPGMTVSVVAMRKAPPKGETLAVPVGAVDTSAEGEFRVWVYDAEKGVVSARAVEVGPVSNGSVPVRSGVSTGDLIVAAGSHMLRDGMEVRPMGDF